MLCYLTSKRVETVGIKTKSCTLSCLPLDICNVFCSCTDAATSSDVTEKRQTTMSRLNCLLLFLCTHFQRQQNCKHESHITIITTRWTDDVHCEQLPMTPVHLSSTHVRCHVLLLTSQPTISWSASRVMRMPGPGTRSAQPDTGKSRVIDVYAKSLKSL